MPLAFTGIVEGVDVARSRNIKPGFFCNEMLAELQAFDRLLFIGLWCLADREGRLEDRPKRIKMELFPCDSYDVNEGLEALKGSGFIKRYSFEDFRVVEILNFSKHQNPHGSEKDSILPDDSGFLTVNERIRNVVASGKARKVHVNETLVNVKPPLENALIPDSGFLIPDSLIPEVKSSCDQQAESQEAGASEVVFSERGFEVPNDLINKWALAYPKASVEDEIAKAAVWAAANPAKRKKNWARFLNSWIAKAHTGSKAIDERDCPVDKIIELYHKECANLPRVAVDTDHVLRGLIAERWNEAPEHKSSSFWKTIFHRANRMQQIYYRGANVMPRLELICSRSIFRQLEEQQ